jgi:hypothetical protein
MCVYQGCIDCNTKIILKIYKLFENVQTSCMPIVKFPQCSMVFNSWILVLVRPY